jgi:hypothetical protein
MGEPKPFYQSYTFWFGIIQYILSVLAQTGVISADVLPPGVLMTTGTATLALRARTTGPITLR